MQIDWVELKYQFITFALKNLTNGTGSSRWIERKSSNSERRHGLENRLRLIGWARTFTLHAGAAALGPEGRLRDAPARKCAVPGLAFWRPSIAVVARLKEQ